MENFVEIHYSITPLTFSVLTNPYWILKDLHVFNSRQVNWHGNFPAY